jgi:hypothetical protein
MKIIVFAPHAAIWVHAFPESLVAEALAQHGHEIIYVSCGKVFKNHCVAMSAFGLNPRSKSLNDRKKVCDLCQANANIIRTKYNFPGFDIDDVLNEIDIAKASKITNEVTPDTLIDIVLEGIEIGRASLSTFFLTQKLISLSFTPERWEILKIELYNTLLSFFAAKKVLEQERPARLILYSSTYSVNFVWCQLAKAKGISFYSMNAAGNLSARLQKIVLSSGHWLNQCLPSYWDKFRDLPCSAELVDYTYKHIIALFQANHSFVYSAPKSQNHTGIRQTFCIQPKQKILLCTMSSFDEIKAAQACRLLPENLNLLFPTQVDWIQALVDFMKSRPDLFLIIRPHPREFSNRRDSEKSEHAEQLEKAFVNLPDNVAVNWPSDNLSLYDVVEEIDVCLNAWSSVGEELSLLGIPVVVYNLNLAFIPPDLNLYASSKEAYFQKIELALDIGWSLDISRAAFRWAALKYIYSRIDISDSYSFIEGSSKKRSLMTRLIDRALKYVDIRFLKQIVSMQQQRSDFKNKASQLNSASIIDKIVTHKYESILDLIDIENMSRVSFDEETRSLRRVFGHIAEVLSSGTVLLKSEGLQSSGY